MINRIDQELSFSRTALNLRSYRQELLASNIANADTPNYKARDIDFKSALSNSLAGKSAGDLHLTTTSASHLVSAGSNASSANVLYRGEYQGAVDGNTVNMDIERSAFAENAVHVEALLTFVREQIKGMNLALQAQ
jgi:flagellar basal-body rod protein FlgB